MQKIIDDSLIDVELIELISHDKKAAKRFKSEMLKRQTEMDKIDKALKILGGGRVLKPADTYSLMMRVDRAAKLISARNQKVSGRSLLRRINYLKDKLELAKSLAAAWHNMQETQGGNS